MRTTLRSAPRWRLAATLALGACLAVGPVAAQEPHREILAGKLQDQLQQIAAAVPGVLGIAVVDLTSGERFGVNDQLVFPQGSAIKVAVLVELYRQAAAGTLRVEEQVAITKAAAVSGSQLQYFKDGTSSLALHDLAVLMIIVSDNMATNLLIDRVGMENVNRTMADLGLPNTKLQRKMIRPEESARGNENLSTPQEAAALMERIFRCDLPLGPAECRELRNILEIPHEGPIREAVPPDVTVGQKTGTITGVRVNWGYVDLPGRPYIVTAMGNYGDSERLSQAIREVADAAHGYFGKLAGATQYGTRVPVRLLEVRPIRR